jgi:RNA polymerase sigma factor (sigma-70 family)
MKERDSNQFVLDFEDLEKLLPELKAMAREALTSWPKGVSVQVSELAMTALRNQKTRDKGLGWEGVELTWENKTHFFRSVRRTMNWCLIDRARKRKSVRRLHEFIDINDFDLQKAAKEPPEVIVALEEAMEELADTHPDYAMIVELRYIQQFSFKEIAKLLDSTEGAVKMKFKRCRILLGARIKGLLSDHNG